VHRTSGYDKKRQRMKTVSDKNRDGFSRRRFLASTSSLGAASLFGLPRPAMAEPPPEVSRIRLVHTPAICFAPQYLAEELLHLEGFSEIEYVDIQTGEPGSIVESGRADMSMDAAPAVVYTMDRRKSLIAVAGIHAGCYELFGNERVRAIRDLKGRTVAVDVLGGADHILLASMLAYVGMDPQKDVNWITANTSAEAMRLFIDGKADAFMGFAPMPQELRAKKIGRVIVDTAQDRPWSQYFCCILVANREFVAAHPVATKRAVRAFLKAADICAQEPERVASYLVTKGYEPRYEIGLEVLKKLPYRRWREANPEDTLRFHALRLHEVGMIKTNPEKLIAQGVDWRFLKEIKKELKA
jgi:NitT/TauT family transport system substrate-binding protein